MTCPEFKYPHRWPVVGPDPLGAGDEQIRLYEYLDQRDRELEDFLNNPCPQIPPEPEMVYTAVNYAAAATGHHDYATLEGAPTVEWSTVPGQMVRSVGSTFAPLGGHPERLGYFSAGLWSVSLSGAFNPDMAATFTRLDVGIWMESFAPDFVYETVFTRPAETDTSVTYPSAGTPLIGMGTLWTVSGLLFSYGSGYIHIDAYWLSDTAFFRQAGWIFKAVKVRDALSAPLLETI